MNRITSLNFIWLLTMLSLNVTAKGQSADKPQGSISSSTPKPVDQNEENGKTYIITDNGSVLNIQPYIDALNSSDMKDHRLRNHRNTIIFRTGVKVDLFSAKELISNGKKVNLSEYPEQFDSSRDEPIFSLGADNYIIEYHTTRAKHQ